MRRGLRTLFGQIYGQLRADLQYDRLLKYILFGTILCAGFWFWWRIPNFVSADEYRRIGQPMKLGRFLFTDSVADTIRQAAEEGIGRDATTYLHGLVLLPLFIVVVLSGELGTLISVSGAESTFALWNAVPAWFWTAALVMTRLLNVVLVVGAVYVTYRIGTVLADRQAGRIAATFTTLSVGVIHTAHEINEDTPALFLLLVVLYLSVRYVQTENRHYFFAGCGLGGLAIAFKLTAGVAVVFLGTAFLLTAVTKPDPRTALWKPRLLVYGLLLGAVTIYVGIPNLLLRGPEWLIQSRIIGGQAAKAGGTSIPHGYSALIAYLNGLGLPLAIATASGLLATIGRISNNDYRNEEFVLLAGLAVYLLVFFGLWQDFKTHHVLPSIPLLTIVFGVTLSRYYDERPDIARIAFVILLVTTTLYAGAGLYQFTNDPRDEAADWLQSEASPEATVTVFENSPAREGLVHGRPVDHYQFGRAADFPGDPYTEWLLSTPDREPEYIQLSRIRDTDQYPRRAEFEDRMLNGDRYGYVIAAEFGEPTTQSRNSELLFAGLVPEVEKRADYKIIFAKNESLT